MAKTEERLNAPEAAKLIGVPLETLRWWKSKDLGPPFIQFVPNGRVWYEKDVLKRWMENRGVHAA